MVSFAVAYLAYMSGVCSAICTTLDYDNGYFTKETCYCVQKIELKDHLAPKITLSLPKNKKWWE